MLVPFASDLINQYLPWYFITATHLKSLSLPHWVPSIYNLGYPLLAEGETGAISPINATLLFLFPFVFAIYLLYLVYLQIAFLGVFAFLKTQKLTNLSCLLGGLTFSSSGFFLSRYFQPAIIFSSSLVPWGFFALERAKTSPKYFFLLPIVIYLQITAGHLQIAFVSVIGYLVYSLFRLIEGKKEIIFIAQTLILCVIGLALAAPQILTSAKLFEISERKNWNEQMRFSYSLPPTHLITYLLPNAYGISRPGDDIGFRQFGGGFWEINLTIWTIPFLLSLSPLLSQKLRKNKIVLGLYLMWFIFLLLSFGGFFKPYRIVNYIPNFPFRVPARFLLISTFAASSLAGFGFEYLFQKTKATFKYLAAAAIIFLTGAQIYWQTKNYFIFTSSENLLAKFSHITSYQMATALPLSATIEAEKFYGPNTNVFRDEFYKGLMLSALALLILSIWYLKTVRPKFKV